ncbi:DUF559 domain-containing protein [Evtepia sp.]|uniref:DUF559 domain-containing protein n=1 Tax=Evtepia sp. TaxID=2773933 RepID=UPI003F167984
MRGGAPKGRRGAISSGVRRYGCDAERRSYGPSAKQEPVGTCPHSAQGNDQGRTRVLETMGIHVIRFSNLDVIQNFDGVCQTIQMALDSRIP